MVFTVPPPFSSPQVQTDVPVHHSPQAVRLRGAGLHLLQLHHRGSGEAQDSAGQPGKSARIAHTHEQRVTQTWSCLFFTSNCIMSSSSPPSLPAPVLSVQERVFLTISNYIFTAIFVGEMTLKVTFYSMSPYFFFFFFSNITANNSLMAVVHTLARACPPPSRVLFPSLLFLAIPMFL